MGRDLEYNTYRKSSIRTFQYQTELYTNHPLYRTQYYSRQTFSATTDNEIMGRGGETGCFLRPSPITTLSLTENIFTRKPKIIDLRPSNSLWHRILSSKLSKSTSPNEPVIKFFLPEGHTFDSAENKMVPSMVAAFKGTVNKLEKPESGMDTRCPIFTIF